ncbi:HAAS signaling domain-containing protein [Candidatus Clostridium radicumherbarum]|uniref:HAAS signaling domain-containing protein n=1 Tax=Candidatus Clostridium radicumherbarum TaxID=3381662 RepID=A0ABW8TXL0_9CLOT
MNRDEFIKTLEASLTTFNQEEKKDILYDYEEHFRIGLQNGKTDEELIKELGSPSDIAKQYSGNFEEEKVEFNSYSDSNIDYRDHSTLKSNERSIIPSIIAALALSFFNLIFVIWIFVAAGAALIGLAAAAISIAVSGLLVTLSPIFAPLFPNYINLPSSVPFILTVLFGIGTTALGALFCIGLFYVIKYFCLAVNKYIKWNISIIKR